MNINIANLDDHSRTIIHLDLDCFYAQVEIIKNPELRNVPLGIQQKNIVVTSNYLAREYGIKKCMLLSEAKQLCPNLKIVNGEDLHDYRHTSYRVTSFLQQYSNLVERLGLDENFVDVTELVKERKQNGRVGSVIGHVVGDTTDSCQCGCETRLIIGTHIAQEIRDELFKELNLTSCAGVSHNKLLAKIVCSQHKPNKQSVVFPNSALELMLSLSNIVNIPGIGKSTADLLDSVNIRTVSDLQNVSAVTVASVLGKDKFKTIQELSYGIDLTPVKSTGRPQSIGLEDSCKIITAEKEVKEKLSQLLTRLLILVEEDGRIPRTIKLTVRKFDKQTKISHRETRQCNINSSLFDSNNISQLTPGNWTKLLKTITILFSKIVNVNKPYHITLLGLAFTKFCEKPSMRNSITCYLKQNLEVQSVTSIENHEELSSPLKDTCSTITSLNTETSVLNIEPALKKTRVSLIAKRRNSFIDSASPSKLRVAELRLSSSPDNHDSNQNVVCPPTIDATVFRELPTNIQKELWEDYKNKNKTGHCNQAKKSKPNSLLNYFSKV